MKRVPELIRWLDSVQPSSSWVRMDDIESLGVCECVSVGFVVAEDESAIMLAQSMADLADDNPQCGGRMQIPKCCITGRRKLR
jgi:hypothetical protein